MTQCLGYCMGVSGGALGSKLWPSPVLAVWGIYKVKQQMEDTLLSTFLLIKK